jgi:hypothetical protein
MLDGLHSYPYPLHRIMANAPNVTNPILQIIELPEGDLETISSISQWSKAKAWLKSNPRPPDQPTEKAGPIFIKCNGSSKRLNQDS